MDSPQSSFTSNFNDDDKKYEKQRIEQQKLEWFSMKERIEEHLEKVGFIKVNIIAQQILKENLICGRGIFCQAIMKSQMKSPQFSNIYAALVAIINSELPDVGHLLVKRLILQFKEAYDEGKNKEYLMNISKFLAHLVNQEVVYELLGMDILLILLGKPSSDNIQIAVEFCIECGSVLQDILPEKLMGIFEEFHYLLRENVVEKQIEASILRLFEIERSNFEKYPRIVEELEVVDFENQYTHSVSLLHVHVIDPEINVDDFKPDLKISESDLIDIQYQNSEYGDVTSHI